MQLISHAFATDDAIPPQFTCDGENVNPPLEIEDAPDGVQSFALIVDDPDAPNGDWVHWLVWNIPADTLTIDEDTVPDDAIQGTTSFGAQEYGGPCPPSGTHHYHFRLYALDTVLGTLEETATKQKLLDAIEDHIIEECELVGTYKRQ